MWSTLDKLRLPVRLPANSGLGTGKPSRHVRILTTVAILGIIIGLRPWLYAFGGRTDSEIANDPTGKLPVRIMPTILPIFTSHSLQYTQLSAVLNHPPCPPMSGPVAIHLLRAFKDQQIARSDVTSGADVLSMYTISVGTGQTSAVSNRDEYAPFIETISGARPRNYGDDRSSNLGENHKDVLAATFAEIGVAEDTPIKVEGGVHRSVKDVVADAMSVIDLHRPEIEWTAVICALYDPSAKAWVTHDGETITRDSLVDELVQRDPKAGCCAGTHLLQAMIYLYRVDQKFATLSPNTRARLHDKISQLVTAAVRSQNTDGSWPMNWYDGESGSNALGPQRFEKILVTGHLLEFLTYLPPDLQPSTTVYAKAACYLLEELKNAQRLSTYNHVSWLCPWTHSICALRTLCAESVG